MTDERVDEGDEGTDEGDEVVYDLVDWDEVQRTTLEELLTAEGVAYRWDLTVSPGSWSVPGTSGPESAPLQSAQLVVADRHAELVEELIDDLDHPDALEADDGADDGAADVLSSLYVASDVLVSGPGNAAAAYELHDACEAATGLALPYGLDAAVWDELRRRAVALADRLRAGASDDEITDAARALRAVVQPLV